MPESESDKESSNARSTKGGIRARRRANTIHSDGGLSFDDAGRHRPAHKNRISQKSGPYQLSRGNSLHSSTSLSSDNLFGKVAAGTGRTARNVPSREARTLRSESDSPEVPDSPMFSSLPNSLPPLDMAVIPPFVSKGNFDLFGGGGFSPDNDGPMYSAGLGAASVDWSVYNLNEVKSGEFAPSSYSQTGAQSYSGMYDFGSEQAPTLAGTTSTSGEVSEVEDNFIPDDMEFDGFQSGAHDFLRQGMSTGLNSIDYSSFVKGSAKYLPTPLSIQDDGGPIVGGTFRLEDDPAFWAQSYNQDGGVAPLSESPDGLPAPAFWDGH